MMGILSVLQFPILIFLLSYLAMWGMIMTYWLLMLAIRKMVENSMIWLMKT